MQEYLAETKFFDFNHPRVQEFIRQHTQDGQDQIGKAQSLYLAVRDLIRYNPYCFQPSPDHVSASHVLQDKSSYCIPKAVLYCAVARGVGIPSRIGLANVTNHLSDQKLIDHLRSDVFVMHGYSELYLKDKWVKATPAFNKELCERSKVKPLEFDGTQDSIFHEFTSDGTKFMEYLKHHGEFADVPWDFIVNGLREAYPHLEKLK